MWEGKKNKTTQPTMGLGGAGKKKKVKTEKIRNGGIRLSKINS